MCVTGFVGDELVVILRLVPHWVLCNLAFAGLHFHVVDGAVESIAVLEAVGKHSGEFLHAVLHEIVHHLLYTLLPVAYELLVGALALVGRFLGGVGIAFGIAHEVEPTLAFGDKLHLTLVHGQLHEV